MISNTAPVRVNFFKQSMMGNRIRASKRAFGMLLVLVTFLGKGFAGGLDGSVQQLIVSVAADWDASTGKLQFFEKANGRWEASGPVTPVPYATHALSWGCVS